MKFLTTEDVKNLLKEYNKEMLLMVEKPMTYEEAAEFLGIALGSLRRLVSQKKVPFSKPAGTVYFHASELNQWIKNRSSL